MYDMSAVSTLVATCMYICGRPKLFDLDVFAFGEKSEGILPWPPKHSSSLLPILRF